MPKNIVLLSDGTGNSSARLLKTNVWRVYESLDLTDPTRQVACYDDGVGTSSFAPLALLGGALGVGLRRNVLRLYRFLCEHYDPGDRIYVFGFSRGAFTVRILVELICDQGIIRTRPTIPVPPHGPHAAQPAPIVDVAGLAFGSELARRSAWAYRAFRRNFNQTGGLVTLARWMRDRLIRVKERVRGLTPYDAGANHAVGANAIDFVGVWDTVDAYGLPVDELTDGVDRWIWPLSMPDLKLSPKVRRACHVLALDDERNTFHPVLWDESGETPAARNAGHLRDERVSQVWFAGMHANVGGGYPDDALSHVSLKWMLDQATDRTRGLALLCLPSLLDHHTSKADPFGRVYDSRQGLKSYYRYNPRRLEWLTNGQKHEFGLGRLNVVVPQVKVHESVFQRIAAAPEAYAPIVLPEEYAVVTASGQLLKGRNNPYESPDAARRRAAAQETTWDLVWQRRLVYFATVGVSLYLLAAPLHRPVTAAEASAIEPSVTSTVLAASAAVLPALTAPWIRYYQAHPTTLLVGAGVLLLLMRRGRSLQARICHTMRGIWLKVVPPAQGVWHTLPTRRSRLTAVRASRWYRQGFAFLRLRVLPNAFGLIMLLALAGTLTRLTFEAVQLAGMAGCLPGNARPAVLPTTLDLDLAKAFCEPTGVHVTRGARYRVALTHTSGHAAPVGPARTSWLTRYQRMLLAPAVPFRRLWGAEWFVPVARVGTKGLEHHVVSGTTEFTAETTGQLYIFVNDVLFPLRLYTPYIGWDAFYENNTSLPVSVTVTRLQNAPQADRAVR